ncbi:hypothetical protein [Nocardia sp. NBC_01009]|uniref:hypothetical protein n=1 Tax=Nocardia sp. NBC_01009 TaxID=2975996 RepID=UPI003868BF58|nr:hypothetical protein OHA42_05445 [Nocardia sp. NBC_01009]
MRTGPITGSLRGCLVGLAVGALAIAAHGTAGGGYPDSAETALMLLIAGSVGCATAWSPIARRPIGLLGVLAGGQLVGHWVLSGLLGHGHDSSVGTSIQLPTAALPTAALPTGWMLAAHVVATFGCAVLIVSAERLYVMASCALRTALTAPRRARSTDQARWPDPGLRHYRFHPNGAIGPRAPPVPA